MAEDVVSVRVDPAFQYAPGNVRYVTRITPHKDNIYYCVGWISEDAHVYERTSCQQLNGIYSPRTFYIEFKSLGLGNYEAFAEVYRAPNRLAGRARQAFRILPPLGGQ